jgi:Icc-related predicted phosphoesterase
VVESEASEHSRSLRKLFGRLRLPRSWVHRLVNQRNSDALGFSFHPQQEPLSRKQESSQMRAMHSPSARVVAHYRDEQVDALPPKQEVTDVRLVVVSDTHNCDPPVDAFPAGDLLLHAGDHTRSGTRDELRAASEWLKSVATRYRHGCVTIGGNHDMLLDRESCLASGEAAFNKDEVRKWCGCDVTLLRHEAVTVAGVTIFGSPYVPLTPSKQSMDAADPRRRLGFNRDEEELDALYSRIPEHCVVLLTHSPPRGLLDTSTHYGGAKRDVPVAIGSTALRDWWERRSASKGGPVLHVFGHEHDARGVAEQFGCLFCNAAAVDGDRSLLRQGHDYSLKKGFRPNVVDLRLG